jgi:hypothetical protein
MPDPAEAREAGKAERMSPTPGRSRLIKEPMSGRQDLNLRPLELASSEQLVGHLIPSQPSVLSDVLQDFIERAQPERGMVRNGYVVLTVCLGRKPDVRTLLPRHDVPQSA